MRRCWGRQLRRVLALVGVTLFATTGSLLGFGAAMAAAAPAVRTCGSGSSVYKVTAPSGSTAATGEDPEETAAVNCAIGYHEKKGYPFSLVGLVLVATALTVAVLHWKKRALDVSWREEDLDMSPSPFPAGGIAGGEL